MKPPPPGVALTWVSEPSPSDCGCVFRRTKEFGDVVTDQCREHALDTALSTITEIAAEVASRRMDPDAAEEKLIEEYLRHSPRVARLLERFYESELARIRLV